MNCPECDSPQSYITQTRRTTTSVRRYRKCRNGHNYITHEILQGRMTEALTAASKVMDLIGESVEART